MSTVNLAETLIIVRDRQPGSAETIEEAILASGIEFAPPDMAQARIAAHARLRYPINGEDREELEQDDGPERGIRNRQAATGD